MPFKHTVTVRDYQGRDTTWQSSSDGLHGAEVALKTKKEDTMEPSGGCMLGLGFWGAIALAGLMAAGALYLRLRAKASPWPP